MNPKEYLLSTLTKAGGEEDLIASPQNTIAVLQKYDFQFKKQFGQNFLVDLHVLGKILRAAEIGSEDVCLEIGPGIGSLTQLMGEAAKRVISVEIDNRLIPLLEENLAAYDNIEIVNSDFMELDLPTFFEEKAIDRPVKVVANLPYYITTPIIMGLFESGVPLDSITVMVQEEVAKRMQAGPGTKDYGALSLAVQYYAEPTIAAYVPQNCFIPRPGVGSAVIHLKRRRELPVETKDEKLMFKLIRAAFGQRRKTLVNSVSGSPELTVSKDQILAALAKAGISEKIRGEALSLADFAK
ncbi:MAG: 16S rRNA (adenine(1518)-N(6)/adenine(1519)-N(6))-dimethyltransferase RsmA, partial [Firmicutes bacterium]|nr:16S rRNA (adenine(1518)-N(6)/adenine(1519)-N(6))-dimethyltransferase RsmA [Bacillota bacterium]